MKKYKAFFFLLTVTSPALADCFIWHEISKGTVDIEAERILRELQLEEVKEAWEKKFKEYDMTNPEAQREWSLVTGMEFSYAWEEAYNDLEYFDSCEVEARAFYECADKRRAKQEALINYRKIYLSYDLSDPKQQLEWALMGPTLELENSTAYDELMLCEKSVY